MSAGKVAVLVLVLGAVLAALLPEAGRWSPGWWGAWAGSWWTGSWSWSGAAGLVLAALCAPVLARLYRLLFRPLELLRSPDDVGYIAEDGRSKAQAANEVRRRRKTGELPPIYPNGWYRVLDSHLLARGEVKSVSILGMLHIIHLIIPSFCPDCDTCSPLCVVVFKVHTARIKRKVRLFNVND